MDILNWSDSDKSYTQTRLSAYNTAIVVPGQDLSYFSFCVFSGLVLRLLAILVVSNSFLINSLILKLA